MNERTYFEQFSGREIERHVIKLRDKDGKIIERILLEDFQDWLDKRGLKTAYNTVEEFYQRGGLLYKHMVKDE